MNQPDWLPRARQGGAHLLATMILVQAFLAGRHLFDTWGISAHGIIGNIIFSVALLVLVAALVDRSDRVGLVLAAALVLVLTAQIGLGYSGRTSAEAAAWHIPTGVLAFGLAVLLGSRRGLGET